MSQGFKMVGCPGIEQVQQPEGSELCFASIVSAMTGASVDEAHRALVAQGLSEADGSTAPMGETRLEVGGKVLEISPFQDPFQGAEDPQGVIDLMDEQFVATRAVALLFKKTHEPEDERHHWALLTGYAEDDGTKGAFRVMDPLRPRIGHLRRAQVLDMVKRSMDFMGVYAYALSTSDK